MFSRNAISTADPHRAPFFNDEAPRPANHSNYSFSLSTDSEAEDPPRCSTPMTPKRMKLKRMLDHTGPDVSIIGELEPLPEEAARCTDSLVRKRQKVLSRPDKSVGPEPDYEVRYLR